MKDLYSLLLVHLCFLIMYKLISDQTGVLKPGGTQHWYRAFKWYSIRRSLGTTGLDYFAFWKFHIFFFQNSPIIFLKSIFINIHHYPLSLAGQQTTSTLTRLTRVVSSTLRRVCLESLCWQEKVTCHNFPVGHCRCSRGWSGTSWTLHRCKPTSPTTWSCTAQPQSCWVCSSLTITVFRSCCTGVFQHWLKCLQFKPKSRYVLLLPATSRGRKNHYFCVVLLPS